jgi:hypothetical protein
MSSGMGERKRAASHCSRPFSTRASSTRSLSHPLNTLPHRARAQFS